MKNLKIQKYVKSAQGVVNAGGFIPCHDKSSPAEIKKIFSMSKKEFKRAIGGLFKKGILDLKENGIQLK